jgi:hypothetical protein
MIVSLRYICIPGFITEKGIAAYETYVNAIDDHFEAFKKPE